MSVVAAHWQPLVDFALARRLEPDVGASTVPEFRNRSAQRALLEARLRCANAQPGSGSHRNAERNGFRVAYTRTKWQKPLS